MRYRLLLALLLAAVSATACASRAPRPQAGVGAPAAAAAVERFLQLAAEKEYLEMGWVFGTESGPVMEQWPQPEVERRMYALASVLQNDGFVLGAAAAVPGRIGRASRFQATLQQGDRRIEVPVIAVLGPGQRWFVEQVALDAVTNVP